MKTTVLDASALLAMFFGQPGMEQVRDLFHKAADADKPMLISAVNWAEVLYKMQHKHGKEGWETARRFEHSMPLDVAPLDRELAESAAHLKSEHYLGLADAFAAALAKSKKAELVTADTEFKPLKKEIEIVWLK
ncbi:MAG: PIN domain-containing protein [Verrucomicrobia bacterium]|nr:PIN domain-containing protein [Verrucomicrobiota bacterium]